MGNTIKVEEQQEMENILNNIFKIECPILHLFSFKTPIYYEVI
jgi:hypothetical protein